MSLSPKKLSKAERRADKLGKTNKVELWEETETGLYRKFDPATDTSGPPVSETELQAIPYSGMRIILYEVSPADVIPPDTEG
jgi:hypothetical protein